MSYLHDSEQDRSGGHRVIVKPEPEQVTRMVQRIESERPSFWSGTIFWFLFLAFIAFSVWQIGPFVLEKYYYAATKGKVRAEYENAVRVLGDDPLAPVSRASELVAQRIRPSVVSIHTSVPTGDVFVRNLAGQGSGVIMSEDGHILTNAHVIEDADQIWVTLHDRRRYSAVRVGEVDELNDIAVLKIDAPDLIPAEWGDSRSLKVGSIVWAIGSPFGYDQSVTSGIVSAKNRMRRENGHQQMLQTDAAVNPGNSGGPLVDSQGRVVGINTAIHGDQFQGISFAVPSEVARYVFEQVIEKGYVDFGVLGAYPAPVYPSDASQMNLPDINGAVLREVIPGAPADIAGLREGDVIRTWNGQPIREHGNLFRFVDMTLPGTVVPVEYMRDGEVHQVNVVVGSRRDLFKQWTNMRIRSRGDVPQLDVPGR